VNKINLLELAKRAVETAIEENVLEKLRSEGVL